MARLLRAAGRLKRYGSLTNLYRFQNLIGARDRIKSVIVASERVKKYGASSNPQPQSGFRLEAHVDTNPIRPAEQRYVHEHGSTAYDHLLKRSFDELFRPE
jgi:hypothetical protein